MKKLITILFLFVATLGVAQINWVQQTPPWFTLDFKDADSIGIVVFEGQVGNFEVIVATTQDTIPYYQYVTGYFNVNNGLISNFSMTQYRRGSYFYRRIGAQLDAIEIRHLEDSIFIERYGILANPLTTPFDTTDLIIPTPPDTTGN